MERWCNKEKHRMEKLVLGRTCPKSYGRGNRTVYESVNEPRCHKRILIQIMKEVEIEQAAIEHSEAMSVSVDPSETIALKDGFIVGAMWRISSAWHKSNEEPISHFKLMLYEDNNGEFELGYTFEPARIRCWALVEDLLPKKEE